MFIFHSSTSVKLVSMKNIQLCSILPSKTFYENGFKSNLLFQLVDTAP